MPTTPSNATEIVPMHIDAVDSSQIQNVDESLAKMSVSVMKEALVKNPYQYEMYVKYLDGLRTKGRLNDLKKARDEFSSVYALTDDLWLQWIEDESSAAITVADKRKILRLFDRAVQDYRSMRIWKEYLKFALEEYKFTHDQDEEERVFQNHLELEAVYDRAKTEFRYHLDTCHDFYLSSVKLLRYLEQNATSDDQKTAFQNKIRTTFHQALKTPCLSYQSTKDAYCSWEKEVAMEESSYDEKIWAVLNDKSYKDAVAAATSREKFEHELSMNSFAFDSFAKYLNFEKNQKDTFKQNRVVALYERALIVNCLDARVWSDYIAFLHNTSKTKLADCGAILRRAVKNVTWAADIWIQLAQNMENSKLGKNIIRASFDRGMLACLPALSAGQDINSASKLVISYCSFLYREWKKDSNPESIGDLRRDLNAIHAHFIQHFPDDDPYARLERFQAKLESLDSFTKLWTNLLKQPIRRSQSELWIEYIQNIKLYMDDFVQTCTDIFQRLVNSEKKESFLDWPERIMEAWMAFEHQYGALEGVENAMYHCKKLESILVTRRAAVAGNTMTNYVTTQVEVTKNTVKRKGGQESKMGSKGKKRGKEEEDVLNEPSTKRVKQEQEISDAPKQKKEEGNPTNYHKTDPSRAPFTVFVSNLPESATEEKLIDFFGLEKEKIREIRLVAKKTDKGPNVYAYVDFVSLTDAKNALLKDRQPFSEEKIAYVAPFKPKDKKVPDYPLNPRKVHISNLPQDITEDGVRELFDECGEITYLKLLDDKEKLRGKNPYAFIEFKEASSGELALALHDLELGGVNISVKLARLEPPTMKQTLGAHFGKGRGGKNLAISLKPRNVKSQTPKNNEKEEEEKKPRTNSDFRAMLGL